MNTTKVDTLKEMVTICEFYNATLDVVACNLYRVKYEQIGQGGLINGDIDDVFAATGIDYRVKIIPSDQIVEVEIYEE